MNACDISADDRYAWRSAGGIPIGVSSLWLVDDRATSGLTTQSHVALAGKGHAHDRAGLTLTGGM